MNKVFADVIAGLIEFYQIHVFITRLVQEGRWYFDMVYFFMHSLVKNILNVRTDCPSFAIIFANLSCPCYFILTII